jgi:hypothetical protein
VIQPSGTSEPHPLMSASPTDWEGRVKALFVT